MKSPTSRRWLAIAFAVYAASTLISMAVMSLGAAFLAVVLFVTLGGPRAVWAEVCTSLKNPIFRIYAGLSAALLAACALSLLVAKLAPLGWAGHYVEPRFFSDMAKSWYFVWPVLLVAGLKKLDESDRALVLRGWILAFGAVSVIGILQHFTGWPRPQEIPNDRAHYHATMFLGHHLSVASILIFPFFAALDFLKKSERGKRILPPGWMAVCALLGCLALFLTYSRMLWIALPLGLILWALRALPRKQAFAVVAAFVFAAGAASFLPSIHNRARDAMGIGDRQALWKANFEFLRLRPLTGAGFRRNIDASSYYLESLPNNGWVFSGHAHNNFIDMLGGTGIIGAIAWLAWCGGIFWILRKGLRRARPDFGWGLVCAWVVFQLNGLTQVNFWEGKVMHQMMWAVAWSLLWVSE